MSLSDDGIVAPFLTWEPAWLALEIRGRNTEIVLYRHKRSKIGRYEAIMHPRLPDWPRFYFNFGSAQREVMRWLHHNSQMMVETAWRPMLKIGKGKGSGARAYALLGAAPVEDLSAAITLLGLLIAIIIIADESFGA